jgi:predicted nucleic acid-binding protein
MAIVADSGGIYGLYDRRDVHHAALRRAIEAERTEIVIPASSLGEIDYLLRVRLGNEALLQFLADIRDRAFRVECLTTSDFDRSAAILKKFESLNLGLSDAAVVAVAERLGTNVILSVDQRDFRAIRSASKKFFRLLPADLPR